MQWFTHTIEKHPCTHFHSRRKAQIDLNHAQRQYRQWKSHTRDDTRKSFRATKSHIKFLRALDVCVFCGEWLQLHDLYAGKIPANIHVIHTCGSTGWKCHQKRERHFISLYSMLLASSPPNGITTLSEPTRLKWNTLRNMRNESGQTLVKQ